LFLAGHRTVGEYANTVRQNGTSCPILAEIAVERTVRLRDIRFYAIVWRKRQLRPNPGRKTAWNQIDCFLAARRRAALARSFSCRAIAWAIASMVTRSLASHDTHRIPYLLTRAPVCK
jgi:hypothetical protein